MLEDDTHSSQSTQDSVDQQKGVTKQTKQPKGQGTKRAKRASRKKGPTDNSGLTKLNRSLFRTPANPKGIIKQVKQKPKAPTKGLKSKKSTALPEKQSSKEIANRLKALKKPDQNLTLFTKNIIRALYELNEKNE